MLSWQITASTAHRRVWLERDSAGPSNTVIAAYGVIHRLYIDMKPARQSGNCLRPASTQGEVYLAAERTIDAIHRNSFRFYGLAVPDEQSLANCEKLFNSAIDNDLSSDIMTKDIRDSAFFERFDFTLQSP
jgi:hypothetical protein